MSIGRFGRIGVLAVGLVLAAFAVRGPVARWWETPPNIAEAALAARESRHDDAERMLDRLLARRPDQRDANLLMAQVLIDRTNPKPEQALTCLARIKTRDPQLRAVLLVQKGKALYQLRRLAEAESAWLEARVLNPRIPEAGWLLIQQYYLQGREDEVVKLALELQPREFDPIDRVRYLLELVREDVERLAAAGVIPWLEPAVQANPGDRASSLALGRALVKEGRTEEGNRLLQKLIADDPQNLKAWDAWLNALADSGEIDALGRELDRVPKSIAGAPELAAHRGRVAQEARRYPEAVAAYEEALNAMPNDPRLLYRLGRMLRLSGGEKAKEAEVFEARASSMETASKALKAAYREASAVKGLGLTPNPALYQRLADLLERLGKPEEALAWHKLVLEAEPTDGKSLEAIQRLGRPAGSDGG